MIEKKILALICVFSLIICTVSCGKEDVTSLSGTYKSDEFFSYTFNSDGTGKQNILSGSFDIHYAVKNNKITISVVGYDSITEDFKFSGDDIVIGEVTYKKVN